MSASARTRIVVVEPGYEDYGVERSILEPLGAEVVPIDCGGDAGRVAAAVRDADGVLIRESPLTAAAIDGATRCRVVVRYGVGVDNIDLDAARRRRIAVANVPDYGAEEVAVHAFALLLAVARRLPARDRAVRAGAWGVGQAEKIYRISGRTLGLVGFGRIARNLHERMLGIGIARTLVFDPYLSEPPSGVDVVAFETLCRESDYVSLHAPLTDATRHLIDAAALALMKPTAILVNTARGPLVDEAALADALRTGRLFGAGIDVFDAEPPPPDHPFFALDSAVVTDHAGWYSEESVAELQRKGAEEIARVLSGEPPKSWVNAWTD